MSSHLLDGSEYLLKIIVIKKAHLMNGFTNSLKKNFLEMIIERRLVGLSSYILDGMMIIILALLSE